MQSAPLNPPAAAQRRAKPEENKPQDNGGQKQGEASGESRQASAEEIAAAVSSGLPPTPLPRLGDHLPPPRVETRDPTLAAPPIDSMFVLDLSAQQETRWHELIVSGTIRKFKFEPRVPSPLPPAIAVRFLKNEGFQLTDAAGNPLQWAQTPRQPHEMGANEVISLGENEVIATYDELNSGALRKRALQLGASEAAMNADREELIAFIKHKTLELKKMMRRGRADASGDDDIDVEEFVPDASMLSEPGLTYAL